jgi:hypothetical protein
MTATAVPRAGRLRLSPPWRKGVLTLHVILSVGWLGLDLVLLVLGVAGLTRDGGTGRAAYLAMGVLADVLLLPVSLGALLSGVVVSLGTKWGLLRHWWVVVKLALTLVAFTASNLALRASIAEAVALAADVPPAAPGRVGVSLVAAPSVALAIYVTATVLSYFKPWGRTRSGPRAG